MAAVRKLRADIGNQLADIEGVTAESLCCCSDHGCTSPHRIKDLAANLIESELHF